MKKKCVHGVELDSGCGACSRHNENRTITGATGRELVEQNERLMAALCEAVKLQSHYAGLLNIYDGGKRIIFQNAGEFLLRLASLKSIASNIELANAWTGMNLAAPGAEKTVEAVYECCSDNCPWRGPRSETAHPKHDPDHLVCPECHEVVELAE